MDLQLVVKMKKVVPMKGEIPHRKGKGIMSGRYPINASKLMINLLKSLDANARTHEINNPKITLAKADKAARPYRRFGSRRFKRTNVLLYAKASKEEKA
jgi:ribosomal protein L22